MDVGDSPVKSPNKTDNKSEAKFKLSAVLSKPFLCSLLLNFWWKCENPDLDYGKSSAAAFFAPNSLAAKIYPRFR